MRRSGEYSVFHDESMPNKRWLMIGLLFVQTLHVDEVRAVLRDCRTCENYEGEIHFSELPRDFESSWGRKARVARCWLRCFEEKLKERVFFSALAVDRHSPAYDHQRFGKEFHAYNRFTAMALKAGIAWHLGARELDRVKINFVSDHKDRAIGPDRAWTDNFEEYLPYRAELDAFLSRAGGRAYPSVSLDVTVSDSASDDLLQLCDLLLGATQMALVAGSSRRTKRELGEMVARWCRDLRQPPWEQQCGLYRRFNLWAFPNDQGKPYADVQLALDVDEGRMGRC